MAMSKLVHKVISINSSAESVLITRDAFCIISQIISGFW